MKTKILRIYPIFVSDPLTVKVSFRVVFLLVASWNEREKKNSQLNLVELVCLTLQLGNLVTITHLPVQNRPNIYCHSYFVYHCYRKLMILFTLIWFLGYIFELVSGGVCLEQCSRYSALQQHIHHWQVTDPDPTAVRYAWTEAVACCSTYTLAIRTKSTWFDTAEQTLCKNDWCYLC